MASSEWRRPTFIRYLLFAIRYSLFAKPLLQVTRHAEAVGVVAHVLVVAETRGRAGGARLAGERAATQHAQAALARRPGRPVGRRAAVGVIPAVLDPFGSVPGSVVETERVGTERGGRHCAVGRGGCAVLAIGAVAARL